MARNHSFVDTVALPSPSASPSPAASSSSLPPIVTHTASSASSSKRAASPDASAPPRKRSRAEITPEERKEARAHRNRIAAQNSRDKRKAQFSALEGRIAELSAENRALRDGMGFAALRESAEQRAAEDARERENRELRERVRTLEAGWDAIIKALQVQGLPAGIPPPFALPQAPTGDTAPASAPAPTPTLSPPSPADVISAHPPTAFPVLVPPPPPVFPLSPAPSFTYSQSTPSPTVSLADMHEPEQHASTRHLAAGGLAALELGLDDSMAGFFDLGAGAHALDAQHMGAPPPATLGEGEGDVDEQLMDDLFREILAASPGPATAPLPPTDAPSVSPLEEHGHGAAPQGEEQERVGGDADVWVLDDAEAEREMQRLLDALPADGAGLGLEMLMGGSEEDVLPSPLEFEMQFEDAADWERASAPVF